MLNACNPFDNFNEYLNHLYKDLTGFISLNRSRESLESNNIHPTYGEILPDSLNHIISQLKLNNNDVFYDLGSGIGKNVVQFFLTTPVKKSCGIEAINKRHDTATLVHNKITKNAELQKLLSQKFSHPKSLEFKLGNFLQQSFNDATIIFMNDVAYSYHTVAKLAEQFNKLPKLKYLICYQTFNDFQYLTNHTAATAKFSWHTKDGEPGCIYNIYSNPSAD